MEKSKPIIRKIKQLQENKKSLLIGIDGRSGSGKSSLAEALKGELSNCDVIHLDSFDMYQGDISIQRVIEEAIKPLISNDNSNKITIFEGIFALNSKLIPYYDFKIWIECPALVGYERGLSRDIALNGIDNSNMWENFWLPKEEEYINLEKPYEKADFILNVI